jgi:hypothetical protein
MPSSRISALVATALLIPLLRNADPALEYSGPPGSSKPFLSATSGGALLATWFEPRDSGRFALRIAARRNGRWMPAATVAESARFFVNWADFPSAIETGAGSWVVHWLEKTESRPYAYHVRLSTSSDRGRTWSDPITAHSDRSPTEHGFVAMLPTRAGGAELIWLDGWRTADSVRGPMTLRGGTLDPGGRMREETELDGRVCDCCQTALAETSEGLIAVYRDRSSEEVRDIAVARRIAGRWTSPATLNRDGWTYRACPVNGPAVAAAGREVAVAWFTGVDGTPRVKLIRSRDAGASFGQPVQIDDGSPLGRADVELLGDGSALVTWLEIVGDRAEWRVKRVGRDGKVRDRWTVGSAPRTREAGFARSAVVDRDFYLAWAEAGPGGGVRIHRLRIP